MNKSVILPVFLVTVVLFFTVTTVQAAAGQYGQYGQYEGGATSSAIFVDKLVGKSAQTKGGTVQYVENMSPSDPRFTPGQNVYFKVRVKNTSNSTLQNVILKDYVPSYIEPLEGPGTYDSNTRIITHNVGTLNAGEEKTYNLLMQVVAQDKLPSDKGLMCQVNKAQAYSNNVSDEDTAQFCIEKQVTGVKQVPSAGPEYGLALLFGSITTLAGGLYLKRKS